VANYLKIAVMNEAGEMLGNLYFPNTPAGEHIYRTELNFIQGIIAGRVTMPIEEAYETFARNNREMFKGYKFEFDVH
jgi:hypothetical protein